MSKCFLYLVCLIVHFFFLILIFFLLNKTWKIYYNPRGFWTGYSAIKKLSKEAKVSRLYFRLYYFSLFTINHVNIKPHTSNQHAKWNVVFTNIHCWRSLLWLFCYYDWWLFCCFDWLVFSFLRFLLKHLSFPAATRFWFFSLFCGCSFVFWGSRVF